MYNPPKERLVNSSTLPLSGVSAVSVKLPEQHLTSKHGVSSITLYGNAITLREYCHQSNFTSHGGGSNDDRTAAFCRLNRQFCHQIIPFFTSRGIYHDRSRKKLLQAQHRLEEAQARDRVKERKARTRRLIQEGAILEKVFPQAANMELTVLENTLDWKLNGR